VVLIRFELIVICSALMVDSAAAPRIPVGGLQPSDCYGRFPISPSFIGRCFRNVISTHSLPRPELSKNICLGFPSLCIQFSRNRFFVNKKIAILKKIFLAHDFEIVATRSSVKFFSTKK